MHVVLSGASWNFLKAFLIIFYSLQALGGCSGKSFDSFLYTSGASCEEPSEARLRAANAALYVGWLPAGQIKQARAS